MNAKVIGRGGDRDILGEGLLWAPRENALYWTDIIKPAVHRLALGSGDVSSWAMPEMIGWIIQRRNKPGFIAGFQSGFAELSLDPLSITPICDPEPQLPGNRLNDAKADRWGRIWAGTMPIAIDRPSGSLYCLDSNRTLTLADSGYTVTNGPAISPDQRWLYHTETMTGLIYRFHLDESGIRDRELMITFEKDWGLPDGMTVDSDGGLWVAHWGGGRVSRFTPDGRFDRSVPLPATQITNVCFAGTGLDRMFVTSASLDRPDEPLAGALFEIDPGGAKGIVPEVFGD